MVTGAMLFRVHSLTSPWTVAFTVYLDRYHVAVVRTPLILNLGICFPDIYDEVCTAFSVKTVSSRWIAFMIWC
jgi:hypothetical protein